MKVFSISWEIIVWRLHGVIHPYVVILCVNFFCCIRPLKVHGDLRVSVTSEDRVKADAQRINYPCYVQYSIGSRRKSLLNLPSKLLFPTYKR